MSTYLRQFVTELANYLDPVLTDHFNNNPILNHKFENITSLIDLILDESFKSLTTKEALAPIFRNVKKNRNAKQIRWYKTYNEAIEKYSKDNIKNPLYSLHQKISYLDADEFKMLYGNKSIKEIEAIEIQKNENWIADYKYFILSPIFNQQTDKSAVESFKNDILINIIKYIENELDGSIDYFTRKFPEDFTTIPIFGATSFSIEYEEVNGVYVSPLTDEHGNVILETSIAKTDMMNNPNLKVMDKTDSKLIMTLLNNTSDTFSVDRTVTLDFNYIVNSLCPGHASRNQRENVKERLLRLVNYSHTVYTGSKVKKYSYLDNIEIDTDTTTVICTFADFLYDVAMHGKIISITDKTYKMIKDPVGSFIVFGIQKARISALTAGLNEKQITYAGFQKMIQFKTKNKSTNINIIMTALDEFVNNKIAIESYTYSNDIFNLKFIPLSQEESLDLSKESPHIYLTSND